MIRKPQIGIIGSMADLNYSQQAIESARKIGELIALNKGTFIFGAEKDNDSLSTAACQGAKKADGLTVGITYGKDKAVFSPELVDIIIPTGLERGGGREFVFVLSCDAIIAISGGSGTLTEVAMAYQAGIPVVALTGFGGWSDKLAGEYLDNRQRMIIQKADNAEEAVKLAFDSLKKSGAK